MQFIIVVVVVDGCGEWGDGGAGGGLFCFSLGDGDGGRCKCCILYTSDAAADLARVVLGSAGALLRYVVTVPVHRDMSA